MGGLASPPSAPVRGSEVRVTCTGAGCQERFSAGGGGGAGGAGGVMVEVSERLRLFIVIILKKILGEIFYKFHSGEV